MQGLLRVFYLRRKSDKNKKMDKTSKMILAISSSLFVFVGYYMWNKTDSIWLGIAAWLPPSVFTAACIDGIRKCNNLKAPKKRDDVMDIFYEAMARISFGLFIGIGIMGGVLFSSVWIGICLWIIPTVLLMTTLIFKSR